jgi:hypothetical protein
MTQENKSILTILFMNNMDLINITSSILCGSTLYVIVFSSMSYVTGQFLWAIILAFGTLTTELSVAIPCFKILLVTHFSLIFTMDPQKLARNVLTVSALLAFLPAACICYYEILHLQIETATVVYLSKAANYSRGVPYLTLYLIFWTLLSILMLLVALFYIPYYLQHHLSSNVVEVAEAGRVRSQVNIKRMLLGFLGMVSSIVVGIIADLLGSLSGVPPQVYAVSLGLNFMLFYNVSDEKVVLFLKEKVLAKLHFFAYWHRGSRVSPPDAEEQENN